MKLLVWTKARSSKTEIGEGWEICIASFSYEIQSVLLMLL